MWMTSPLNFVRRMNEEFTRMLDDFGMNRQSLGSSWREMQSYGSEMVRADWSPRIDVFEREGKLVVQAELPGLRKEDVTVEMRDGAVVLRGERSETRETTREAYYRRERTSGRFYRSVTLPDDADPESAKARFQDGLLEVTLDLRRRESRGRKLTVD
jgi:HSP20 family protein